MKKNTLLMVFFIFFIILPVFCYINAINMESPLYKIQFGTIDITGGKNPQIITNYQIVSGRLLPANFNQLDTSLKLVFNIFTLFFHFTFQYLKQKLISAH